MITFCEYSDLPPDECHHCRPDVRPGDPTKAARARRATAALDGEDRASGPPRWADRGGRS